MEDVGFYKTLFNRKLNPIKVMLVKKKEDFGTMAWIKFVKDTKERILKNPTEYLGTELPPPEILKTCLEIIFTEFISRGTRKKKDF